MNVNLLKKNNTKKIYFGVIGLGYVGLPIANRFIKEGIKVYALEQDLEKINKLKKE